MEPWRSQNYEQQHILNNLWFHQVCIYETVELCVFCVVENERFEKHDGFNQRCRYKLDETIAFQHF